MSGNSIWIPGYCEKCGELVFPGEDAVLIEAVKNNDMLGLLNPTSKHLFPTENCPGSPSRAQYFDGQPKDSRYPYNIREKAEWNRAYNKVKRACETSGGDRIDISSLFSENRTTAWLTVN
jgi:hypothetical protein